MASTPTAQRIALRSPFNGEVILMEFLPGVPPTLETLLAAGFVRIESNPKSKGSVISDPMVLK